MDQLALMIDLERCTGCKSCEAACKQTNALGPHTYRNRVMWFDEQHADAVANFSGHALELLTVTCQQCERPACLRACPVVPKAISKDPLTGVVAIDTDRCTGCGECAISCPYGAIGYNPEKHHAVKCDLCSARRQMGSGPACASVCPTHAISFGKREDLLEQANKSKRTLLEHDHFLQKPATIYLKKLTDNALGKDEFQQKKQSKIIPSIMLDDRVRENLAYDAVHGSYDKNYKKQLVTEQERIVPGGCNICFNACPVKYHLRDNKIVNIYGNDDDPIFKGKICPKSQMTLQLYNNPDRIVKPLKRVGKKGTDQFVEITWQQALDEIAEKLINVKEQYGSDALAIQAGSRTGVLNLMGAIPLFAGLWGTANVAATEPFCDLGKSVSLEMTQGSTMLANIYTADDIGSAELYVYFGDNQAETRPVNFGIVNDWRLKNNAKLVVVDPRMTPTASKADQWIAIRTGTDLALCLAMTHHIFSHQLADLAFCEQWVLGWETWRQFIFEQDYSPQWASHITDIPEADIIQLAESIAKADGCFIYLSRGVNQHSNSAQTNRAFMFLAAITGNWGRKGGGYFNVSSEPDWQLPIIPENRIADKKPSISKNPAGWLDAMLGNDIYPIRALITGNNPAAQWPNQEKVHKALANLDLIVHMDLFLNETSMHADYVLPMASGIEKGGTTRFAEDRRIVWNDRLIDPPGEAKSDHWFWIELGKYFGFEDILKEDYKNPRALWDQVLCPATPAIRGLTTKRLLQSPSRNVRMPLLAENDSEETTLYLPDTTAFGQSQGKRFPTPSGKLEFWSEDLEKKFAIMGLSALPEFYTEKEQLISLPSLITFAMQNESIVSPFFHNANYAKAANIDYSSKEKNNTEYDTELVTGRPAAPHFHSWTHYFWQAQEMWPELYCQIHPEKAHDLAISDGDVIKIETQQGDITARAWIHAGIRKTSIFIPIGWDERQPFHPAKTVNKLTSIVLDPISQQANLKSHLCKVSRV